MGVQHVREAGTIPGAEGINLQEGNSRGVLLLHGFGDTPQTLLLLARELSAAGNDVVVPLLPGHGTSVESFIASRRKDWLELAREELARIRATHSSVVLGGLSMGGALAAILASEARDIESLILLAPYLDVPARIKLAAGTHWIWSAAAGARRSNSPSSILDPAERKKNLGYGVYSGRLLFELWRLAASAQRSLSRITAPTLLIQSRRDPRIRPAVAERAIAAVGAREKKLVWVEGAGHIITVDYGRAIVFEEVKAWISRHQMRIQDQPQSTIED
ncbi:MAG TPA: alpha/beta fold hydrolase [Gemmatimonadaceae bacterium]|nr:alpha/beta fold hydrolase [Gemmatimonadaceae bacterium]